MKTANPLAFLAAILAFQTGCSHLWPPKAPPPRMACGSDVRVFRPTVPETPEDQMRFRVYQIGPEGKQATLFEGQVPVQEGKTEETQRFGPSTVEGGRQVWGTVGAETRQAGDGTEAVVRIKVVDDKDRTVWESRQAVVLDKPVKSDAGRAPESVVTAAPPPPAPPPDVGNRRLPASLLVPLILLAAITATLLLVVLPFWFICRKAGFPGVLSLLMLVPLCNVVLVFILAFYDWPSQRQATHP